jgi:hypothetical protein
VGSEDKGQLRSGVEARPQSCSKPAKLPPLPPPPPPQDKGVSMRKRAVKALWECCARCPGFTRRTDAVVAILQRWVRPGPATAGPRQ